MYRIPFKILAFSRIHFIHIISMEYSSIIFSFHFILNQMVNIYRWNLKLASDILFSCSSAIRRGNILNRIQHVVLSLSFFLIEYMLCLMSTFLYYYSIWIQVTPILNFTWLIVLKCVSAVSILVNA